MNDKVGNRIYEFRTLRRFTQAYVAKKLNISQSAYSHFETGRREITVTTLYAIADILDVSVHDLLPIEELKFTTKDIIDLNEYKRFLISRKK